MRLVTGAEAFVLGVICFMLAGMFYFFPNLATRPYRAFGIRISPKMARVIVYADLALGTFCAAQVLAGLLL
jgi:hypothetical protein